MQFIKAKTLLFAAALIVGMFSIALAQAKQGEGTVSQRLEVMSQKLETMRRSLKSAASVLEQENKDDVKKAEKENLDSPHARLVNLEKEAGRLQSEVNNLKGKVDR